MNTNKCKQCGHALHGRSDKKFCDSYCRAQFHNEKLSGEAQFLKTIERILRRNRRILRMLAGKTGIVIQKKKLEELGFKFDYFTHRVKKSKDTTCYFCYDHGLLPIDQNRVAVILNDVVTENG